MITLLVVLVIGIFLYFTVDIKVSKNDRRSTEMTMKRDGRNYRLQIWSESGFITTKSGWSRSVDLGNGWQIIEEGAGPCPYQSLTGQGWAQGGPSK